MPNAKFLLVIAFYSLLFALCSPNLASAQEEASPSSSIKEKVEALKKEVASKAAQLKTEVNKDLKNKAYVGTVTSINSNQITLLTLSGQKIVKVNEYTNYKDETSTRKQKLDLKNLKEDDFIAALGDVDDNKVLTAKRVVISKKVEEPKEAYFWGQVREIQGNNVIIKAKDGAQINVTTLASTLFQLGNEEATLQDVKVNKHLAGIGTSIKDGKTQARFLYLIPSIGYVKPDKKVSSPSATPAINDKR